MSGISEEAKAKQRMINAKCTAKSTGSSYYQQQARIAELEYEKEVERNKKRYDSYSRNNNKGFDRDDW
jgi:hypothetical protein